MLPTPMIFESWCPIDSEFVPLRKGKVTTVMLGSKPNQVLGIGKLF